LKKPIVTKKETKSTALDDDIFADIKITKKEVNKAKKDWSVLNSATQKNDEKNDDDLFGGVTATSTKKSKTADSKLIKNTVDNIFDDPLNVLKK